MHPIVISYRPSDKLYQMITLTTKGGREITLTPESLFGLVKVDGKVVLKTNKVIPNLLPMHFDTPQKEPFDRLDPRYWYIAGLVISGGNLPRHQTHAAVIYYPNSRAWEAEILRKFLVSYFEQFDKPSFVGRHPKTEVTDSPLGVALSSKMLNSIVNRLSHQPPKPSEDYGNFILSETDDERSLFFLRGMTSPEAYSGFMAGFLGGMAHAPNGRTFLHRSAQVVRTMNTVLFEDFGIPTELIINPHEDPVMSQWRKVNNPHTLVLHREEYLKVQEAGLAHWDQDFILHGGPHLPLNLTLDSVVSIRPSGEDNGTPIIAGAGEEFVSYRNFLFHPEFEPNPTAIDIATMNELFAEVVNPAEIIKNMSASMAGGVHL